MNSLFLLALPRSLSSVVYHLARRAVGLQEPTWTSDGEVLNLDRHVLFAGDRRDTCLKYLWPAHAPGLADQITCFLDHVTVRRGFAYKDVIQPFLCTAWRGLAEFRVLRIRRPLADVASSVLASGWQYPGYAVRRSHPTPDDVLRGLLRADAALAAVPAVDVAYDDLVRREGTLWEALAALYPGLPIRPLPYLDAAFIATRERQLNRRQSPQYRELAARLDELERSSKGATS